MSIQSEINRISTAVANAYDVLEGLGATMPETRNVENLASTIELFFNKWYSATVNDGELYIRSIYNATQSESTLYIE